MLCFEISFENSYVKHTLKKKSEEKIGEKIVLFFRLHKCERIWQFYVPDCTILLEGNDATHCLTKVKSYVFIEAVFISYFRPIFISQE